MILPQGDYILLSVTNTALRDKFSNFEDLCGEYGWDEAIVSSRLNALGYFYNRTLNAFVLK